MTPEPRGALEARVCAADLLSAMQGLMAAVIDSRAAYEAERERIEEGVGSDEATHRSLAELDAAHQHRRAMHEQGWGELQGEAEIAERPAQA
jgi:rhodanese-related sulfurtransferase